MRALSVPFAAHLASGVGALAHVWRIARKDGAVFALTDHDRPILFDGLLAAPQRGLDGGALEKSVGLSVDTASVSGVLDDDAISEDDLARGLWDGARVDIYRVDWRAPHERAHMFAGALGEARRGVHGFELEVRGLQAPLNRPTGRVFSRSCDADVGDARCGVDLDAPAYRGFGAVTEILGARSFRASGLGGFANGWFTRGVLAWTLGGAGEVAAHSLSTSGVVIELLDDPGPALIVGAAFSVRAGCDKRMETCALKFGAIANFRGFPHMPGNDMLQAGPGPSVNDGSSRWR